MPFEDLWSAFSNLDWYSNIARLLFEFTYVCAFSIRQWSSTSRILESIHVLHLNETCKIFNFLLFFFYFALQESHLTLQSCVFIFQDHKCRMVGNLCILSTWIILLNYTCILSFILIVDTDNLLYHKIYFWVSSSLHCFIDCLDCTFYCNLYQLH